MPIRSILITQEELRRFLQKNFKGFETKGYELLTGWFIAMVQSLRTNKEHLIGLPLKKYSEREVSAVRNDENIEHILQSYIEEDTPVDLILVSEDEINVTSKKLIGEAVGRAYQLKRFGFQTEAGDVTDDLLKYLSKKIPQEYAPSKTDLVLVIGGGGVGGGNFDMDRIEQKLKQLNPKTYPFRRILFMSGDSNYLFFGEFWPSKEFKKYTFPL